MFKKNTNFVEEEKIQIRNYGNKISKELKVFYNPLMKLNRDISMLVIKSYFNKQIKFCDPMAASGIRELRFLKTIPEMFNKLYIGDISKTAIKNIKKNAKSNKISLKKVKLKQQNAILTMMDEMYDFIEIDPFGSPVPFLDIAIQRIKHEGILSVTATDTATLCGTYPNKTLRKYGIKVEMTHFHEELGLRNLIAYCQVQAAKYDKKITPIISYSQDHYYKIFFKVEDGRQKAIDMIKKLSHITWERKTQDVEILKYEKENSLGKTYIGKLCNFNFLIEIKKNINLIEDNKKINKLTDKLITELDIVGYYNIDKIQKENKFTCKMKYDEIISKLENKGFIVSRTHNSRVGIKTTAKCKDIMEVMKQQ